MLNEIQVICRVNTDDRVEDEPQFLMVGVTLAILDDVKKFQKHLESMKADGLNPYKVTTYDAPSSIFVDPFGMGAQLEPTLPVLFNDDEADAFETDPPADGQSYSTLTDIRDESNSVGTLIMEVKAGGILVRAGFANEYWASTRVITNETLDEARGLLNHG